MKIILEPTVEVIAKPTFIESKYFEIPDDGEDCIKLGAMAAKVCYDSDGKDGRPNIENQRAVIESRHGSCLEHAHISLFITGITRALSLELNRHRPFNISQRSTRYTKEEDSAIVLDPYYAHLFKKYDMQQDGEWGEWQSRWYHLPFENSPSLTNIGPDATTEYALICEFLENCEHAIDGYKYQVDTLIRLNPENLTGFDLRKWARGKARNLLPHALETRGVWTNNFRGLRWFIELRSEAHAEPEIRVLANKIFEAVAPLAPTYFEDFNAEEVRGISQLTPKYSKI